MFSIGRIVILYGTYNLHFPQILTALFWIIRVPVRVIHVAIGESSKELAKPNLWIWAILAKSMINNISLSWKIAQSIRCFKIIASEWY